MRTRPAWLSLIRLVTELRERSRRVARVVRQFPPPGSARESKASFAIISLERIGVRTQFLDITANLALRETD